MINLIKDVVDIFDEMSLPYVPFWAFGVDNDYHGISQISPPDDWFCEMIYDNDIYYIFDEEIEV